MRCARSFSLASLARGAALAAVALAACDNSEAFHKMSPGWERMQIQPRGETFGESAVFADGRTMRTPPVDTLRRDADQVPSDEDEGDGGQGLVRARIPLTVDAAMLGRGRESFETICAVCHGVRGDGVSVVASKMQQRRPPSLYEPRIRALPDGELAAIVRRGYGFMPALASTLDARSRWEVVAYLRALQASRVERKDLSAADLAALDAVGTSATSTTTTSASAP